MDELITYKLKCNSCSKGIEIIQSIKDKLPDKCECGGELKQVFTLNENNVLIFTNPMNGAISKRFA